jgi:hypothetical protein
MLVPHCMRFPVPQLIEAGSRALKKLWRGQPADVVDRLRWPPVVDGDVLPVRSSVLLSADLPLIVGTTMHERNPGIVDGRLENAPDRAERRILAG